MRPSIEFPPCARNEQRLEARFGETDIRHRRARIFDDGDDEVDPDEHEAAAWLIDIAAAQLEKAGLITTEKLADLLIDDKQDYSMTLTKKGEAFVASGKTFSFSDPE